LACQSKLVSIANQPKQLVDNPQVVGHFPTNMHMDAFVYVANLSQHELNPLINPTWHIPTYERLWHEHPKNNQVNWFNPNQIWHL
jgi:hypothetical protein